LLDTSTPGAHTLQVEGRDKVGNIASVTRSYTVAPPPTITITTPVNGSFARLGQGLNAAFSCTDRSGTGMASCPAQLDGVALANGQRLDTAHGGPPPLTVTAIDAAGGRATASSTYTVDVTPPSIVITTPPDGMIYTIGTVVAASYACSDPGGSGVISCS